MATIREVATRAAVAPITVSRVLNAPDTVAPATRTRVEAAIAELNYVPNILGQGLRHKHTQTIGLVISDIRNPFHVAMIEAVEDVAHDHDYAVVFVNAAASDVREREQLRTLIARRVDGILLVPVYNTPESVDYVQRHGIPIAVIGYPMPDNDVDVVRCDSVRAAKELTDYLIALGHRRLAMLSGPERIVTAVERATGYEQALGSAGLELAENPVVFGQFDPVVSRQLARGVLDVSDPPTAIVTASNFIALGVAHAAADIGVRVPEDLSIATFDAPLTDFVLDPFFTGIVQPASDMARIAAEHLFDFVDGRGEPRDTILPTTFEVHASTGPTPVLRAP